MSIEAFYGDWRRDNELIVRPLRQLSDEKLALRSMHGDGSPSTHWPIWAIAGHTVGTPVDVTESALRSQRQPSR